MENNWNDSVGTNNGTGYNGVTFTTSGKVGSYGGSFDGTNDYVEVPDAAPLNITNAITVMGWVKLTNTTGWKRLLGKWSGSGYLLTVRDGKVQASLRNNHYQANSIIGTNQWAHVAFTFNSGGGANNLKVYLNGALDASFTLNNTIDTTTNPLRIGTSEVLSDWLPGNADDVALWSSDLSATQIQTIYARQSAKYSGSLTSRVLDAFSSQSWTTLAPTTTLPFYKELPGSSGSESSSNYSSVGGSLMTGLAGLWHLNQSTYTGVAGDVPDSSGLGVNGTSSGTPLATVGALGNGAYFGSGPYISIPNASFTLDITNTVTTCYWMNTTDIAGSTAWTSLVGKMNGGGGSKGWTTSRQGSNQVIWIRADTSAGFNQGFAGTTAIYDGKNHHICVSFDQGNLKAWIDGKSEISTTYLHGTAFIDGYPVTIGNFGGGSAHKGMIDEVAIWNRVLSTAEVKEVYRRGANRVKYQLRSCSASDCSDQDALSSTHKGWKGPDNTGLSYFSELYNTTSNALAGTVSTGAPTMTFSNFSGTGLSVTANRYFQYRAILESDDQNTLCNYGSGAVACSPELKSIDIGPNHYDTTIQSIISKSTIGSAYQTLDVNGMTETHGSNSCSSGAKYSASSDGSTFYYWNGSAWTTSSAYATANDAATMRTNISSFPSSAAGTGTLQIKTYLKSSGTSACEVDNLQFTGRKY